MPAVFVGSSQDTQTALGEGEDSVLPPGYRLDIVGDPCLVVLRREDGTVVARFSDRAAPRRR